VADQQGWSLESSASVGSLSIMQPMGLDPPMANLVANEAVLTGVWNCQSTKLCGWPITRCICRGTLKATVQFEVVDFDAADKSASLQPSVLTLGT